MSDHTNIPAELKPPLRAGSPIARSLDDYPMRHADALPRGKGKNAARPALSWCMWQRAEMLLVQHEEHRASPDTAPLPNLKLLASEAGEWGSIERVTIERDPRDNREVLGLHFPNYETGALHLPRLFDPPCGLLLLMLALPGGSVGFNPDGGGRTHVYYGAGGSKVPARRILADTEENQYESDNVEDREHPFGFRSYLLRDRLKPRIVAADDFATKASYQAREEAVGIALTCFDRRARHLLGSIASAEYAKMLLRCMAEVDHLRAAYL